MQFLTEVILCVKEVNKKTRAAAFDLLVKLARAMEDANPASAVPNLDSDMGMYRTFYCCTCSAPFSVLAHFPDAWKHQHATALFGDQVLSFVIMSSCVGSP